MGDGAAWLGCCVSVGRSSVCGGVGGVWRGGSGGLDWLCSTDGAGCATWSEVGPGVCWCDAGGGTSGELPWQRLAADLVPLVVGRAAGGGLTQSWDGSCGGAA